MTDTTEVGATIRRIRQQRRMSQQELSDAVDRAGLNQAAISKIELGRRDLTLSQAQALADALGVTISDLTGQHANELEEVVRRVEAELKLARLRNHLTQILRDLS